MFSRLKVLLFTSFFIFLAFISQAHALKVQASIKPLYSLVSMVTKGVKNTELVVKGNTSPHHIQLSAQEMWKLNHSDVVFLISERLEQPIYRAVSDKNKLHSVLKFPGLTLLNVDNTRLLFKKGVSDNKNINVHIWLDPDNAKIILQNVATILAQKDPANAKLYKKNAFFYSKKLNQLKVKVNKLLRGSPSKFIFYHNGFSYFEHRFHVYSVGSLITGTQASESFGNLLSNKNLVELGQLIQAKQVKCVFTEPQFHDRVLLKFLKNNHVKHCALDPVGFNLTPNSDLYFILVDNIAKTIASCK